MVYATLSADIVKPTSFSANDTFRLRKYLQSFIDNNLAKGTDCWGRIIKGDGLELVETDPNNILRLALMLKCYVRFFAPEDNSDKDFKRYGIRIAISVGELRINDKEQGIIDGEAIYHSGRGLYELSESRTDTLLFVSDTPALSGIEVICSLIDAILNQTTARQCEILYYKLLGYNESKIAEILNIKQSTVNQHAAAASWNAIAKAVNYFENYPFNIKDEL